MNCCQDPISTLALFQDEVRVLASGRDRIRHRSMETRKNPGIMSNSSAYLLARSQSWLCAIPINHVQETMRPLDVRPLVDMSGFVLGVSLIRGKPTPVVALSMLLSDSITDPIRRFVTLRVAERTVALGVQEVLGIFDLKENELEVLAPLLQRAKADLIETVGAFDKQLVVVLKTVRLLSEDDWRAFKRQGT